MAETMLRWESITPFGLPSRVSPNAANLRTKGIKVGQKFNGSILSILEVRPKRKEDLRLKSPGEADGGCSPLNFCVWLWISP